MTTLTIKVNEKSETGKSFLSLIYALDFENKNVNIVRIPNKETEKVIEDMRNGKGISKVKNAKELFKQLGI